MKLVVWKIFVSSQIFHLPILFYATIVQLVERLICNQNACGFESCWWLHYLLLWLVNGFIYNVAKMKQCGNMNSNLLQKRQQQTELTGFSLYYLFTHNGNLAHCYTLIKVLFGNRFTSTGQIAQRTFQYCQELLQPYCNKMGNNCGAKPTWRVVE